MIGNLEVYGDIWFYPDGIANIPSLHHVVERFHITYDSCVDNYFTVWKQDGCPIKSTLGPRELYFCNLRDIDGTILTTVDTSTSEFRSVPNTVTNKTINIELSTIDIVEGNKSLYTQRQISGAENSRKMQNTIGLTTKIIIQVVDRAMMNSCPFNRQSIKNAISIFGPSAPNLQGNSTLMGQGHVNIEDIPSIPGIIIQRCRNIVLGKDVVKINGV